MVFTTIALILSIGVGVSPQASLRSIDLRDLTVPAERLPAGCSISPERLDSNQGRGRNWAGLPIATNPWAGSDPPIIARIRERIDGRIRMADGPPPTAAEAARFRLKLAEGVDEAYAAIYTQTDSNIVIAYALRFAQDANRISIARASDNPKIVRVASGPIAAVVTGDGGEYFQAVGNHVKSLVR
jgi:hypothetical protein